MFSFKKGEYFLCLNLNITNYKDYYTIENYNLKEGEKLACKSAFLLRSIRENEKIKNQKE